MANFWKPDRKTWNTFSLRLSKQTKDMLFFLTGLYPLIGWKIGDKLTYVAEGLASDTGTVINWAQKIGELSQQLDKTSIEIFITFQVLLS